MTVPVTVIFLMNDWLHKFITQICYKFLFIFLFNLFLLFQVGLFYDILFLASKHKMKRLKNNKNAVKSNSVLRPVLEKIIKKN